MAASPSATPSIDFNPTDGVSANSYDFIGVAIHEIGHALGFRRGVDSYDSFTSPGSATARAGALENSVVGTSLDLFRYTDDGKLDWSTQGKLYFSIDGGKTQLFGDSLLATGVTNGDGRQASHCKDSVAGVPQRGTLDPTSGLGQMQQITALDLAAFDAIGWTTSIEVLTDPTYRFSSAGRHVSRVRGQRARAGDLASARTRLRPARCRAALPASQHRRQLRLD